MQQTRAHSSGVAAGLALSFALLSACGGLGVEQYREAEPTSTLVLRRVADPGRSDVEHLARLDGAGTVALEPGAILRAEHVAQVQLLESGDGERLVILQLRDSGRARLREATAGSDGHTLALVADGVVVATPTVRGTLDQSEIAVRVPRARANATFDALR